MKSIDALEFIANIIKKSIEEKKFTGNVDIHFDCSQGSACNIKIALCEKSVTVFELNKSN